MYIAFHPLRILKQGVEKNSKYSNWDLNRVELCLFLCPRVILNYLEVAGPAVALTEENVERKHKPINQMEIVSTLQILVV
jgi:hypothetical protein